MPHPKSWQYYTIASKVPKPYLCNRKPRMNTARRIRNRSSADFQSAISRISNPHAREGLNALPTGSRRHSRFEICATASCPKLPKKFVQGNKTFMEKSKRFFPAQSGNNRVLLSRKVFADDANFSERGCARSTTRSALESQSSSRVLTAAAGLADTAVLLRLRFRRAVFIRVHSCSTASFRLSKSTTGGGGRKKVTSKMGRFG